MTYRTLPGTRASEATATLADTDTDTEAAVAAGIIAAGATVFGEGIDQRAAFLVPAGYELAIKDLIPDSSLDRPVRAASVRDAHDLPSFMALLGKHATPDAEVYCDLDDGTITAVLDAGTRADRTGAFPGLAAWMDNRITWTVKRDADWLAWRGIDGRMLPQDEFAEFIEQNARCVIQPTYADMLELAQSIQVNGETAYKARAVLASGAFTLVAEENRDARAGTDGNLTVPKSIELDLRPFTDNDRLTVEARFRYRIQGGRVLLGVRLIQAEQIERDAWDLLVSRIRGQVGELPDSDGIEVLNGTAPEPRRA